MTTEEPVKTCAGCGETRPLSEVGPCPECGGLTFTPGSPP